MTELWKPEPQYPFWESWLKICPGDWLMWVMPTFVRVGQVEYTQGISLVIKFQGDAEPTVIPDAYSYWLPWPHHIPAPENSLTRTSKPAILVDAITTPEVSVRQAAARLGITPKNVRRLLRSSQLRGRRENGKWVAVTADSLSRLPAGDSPSTG